MPPVLGDRPADESPDILATQLVLGGLVNYSDEPSDQQMLVHSGNSMVSLPRAYTPKPAHLFKIRTNICQLLYSQEHTVLQGRRFHIY